MKQFTPTNRRARLARATGSQRRNVIAVAGFAPVQFAVSIGRMPASTSEWRCSSAAAPVRPACAPRPCFRVIHSRALRSDENPQVAIHESAATAHSRPVALHGAAARGAVVSRRVWQTPAHAERVAVGGAGPRAKAGKRRTMTRVVSRFTEAAIGSRPIVPRCGQS